MSLNVNTAFESIAANSWEDFWSSQSHKSLSTCYSAPAGWIMTRGFPHLPPFWAHLVKLEAVDRTAGVLMIPFSGCPATPYPLTFPSEENSQWTGAAPSQTPFPLACCPPDVLESQACSCVWVLGGGRCVYCLFPMNFNIRSFGLHHYLEETAFLLWHFFIQKKCICGLFPIYFYLIPF